MGSIKIEAGENEYENKPPKGAKILKHNVNTNIEKIKNGYLVTHNHRGKYQTGKGPNDYSHFDYSEKHFSPTNPVQVNSSEDENFEQDSDLANNFPPPKGK
jgi:hypothetical protein